MPGKSSILLAIFLFFCASSMAQSRFMQATGYTVSFLKGFQKDRYGSSSSLLDNSFTYFPRYNLAQDSGTSFSVGAPVGIGLGYISDINNRESALSFSYHVPVVFDYNIGYGSTRYNDKKLGGYLGVGFGTYQSFFSNKVFSGYSTPTYGPIVRGGMRFAPRRINGRGVEAGLFYKKGLESAKIWTVGLNLFLNFY